MATEALAANWFAFGSASPRGSQAGGRWSSAREARAADDFSSLVACANFAHVATFTSDASKGASLGTADGVGKRDRWTSCLR